MKTKGDPRDIPEWHAPQREAALVRHLVGSGVTALGTAEYGDRMGVYYTPSLVCRSGWSGWPNLF
jgi:hypothetical protein